MAIGNSGVLSTSMSTNLLTLQNTQKMMDATQNRLATGKKVNSALDNPSSFFTASNLNNRASDLNALLDTMGQAVQTIKSADEAIKSITNLVQQAKSLANTAIADKSSTYASKGTFDGVGVAAGGPASDGMYTLKLNGTDVTVDMSAATEPATMAELQAALQTAFDGATTAAGDLTVAVVDGKISVTATDGKSHSIEGSIGGLNLGGTANNTVIASSEKNYNEILAQIDELAADAGYKGVNLLGGDDLKVVFNEDRSSSLNVAGVKADSTSIGLLKADFSTTAGIQSAINGADTAISNLRAMSTEFSNAYTIVQNREEFTSNLVNVLTEGADKLTLADMNEEAANMLALQTRQQLGVNALSLASQAAQNVLKLF